MNQNLDDILSKIGVHLPDRRPQAEHLSFPDDAVSEPTELPIRRALSLGTSISLEAPPVTQNLTPASSGAIFDSDMLAMIVQDNALWGTFQAQHPGLIADLKARLTQSPSRSAPRMEPFPDLEKLTALQLCIFDNWPNGTPPRLGGKGKGARKAHYGIALEGWVRPAHEIKAFEKNDYDFKANGVMWAKVNARARADKLAAEGSINAYYAEFLSLLAESEADKSTALFPLVNPGCIGRTYFDKQVLVVRGLGGPTEDITSTLWINEQVIHLAPVSDLDPSGRPITNGSLNRIQSRCDLSGFSTTWATGPVSLSKSSMSS